MLYTKLWRNAQTAVLDSNCGPKRNCVCLCLRMDAWTTIIMNSFAQQCYWGYFCDSSIEKPAQK